MRRNKSFFAVLLMAAVFSMSACSLVPTASRRQKSSSEPEPEAEVQMPEAYKIYQLYVAQGGTLTYEEWLESVRGEPGQDGHSPVVTIGSNGNWLIDGNDTGIRAQGEKGDKGDQGEPGQDGEDGKSAYEKYLEEHPDYNRTEEQWLDDLLNGRLGAESIHIVAFDTNGGSEIDGQTINHGDKIAKPEDPTKPGYVFKGWTYLGEPWSFAGYVVTEDMTLEAVWEAIDYVATFKNEDGTILDVQENVHYGDNLIYHGESPQKPNPLDHYIYSFTGWDKQLTVTGDMEFIATYNQTYAPFSEVYLNADGSELYTRYVLEQEIGTDITFNGSTPEKIDNLIRLESEDAVLSSGIQIEYKDFDSNGKNIGYFDNGLSMVYNFTSTQAVSTNLYFCIASDRGYQHQVNEFVSLNVNGTDVVIGDDAKMIESTSWEEWEVVKVANISLKSGNNIITINSFSGLNFDYIGLEISAFNVFEHGVNVPTKDNEGDIQFLFSGWDIKQITDSTVVYEPHFESCTIGLTFENNHVYSYRGNAKEVYVPGYWNGYPITDISERTFESTDVEKVIIAEGIKTISSNAFRNCPSLEEVVLPSSLRLINNCAFEYCSALKSINVPEGVTDVRYSAFSECHALETAIFPETVTIMRNNVFWNCKALKNFVIPSTCTYLESGAFLGCSSLESITIPEGVTHIGNGCFADCRSLKTINMNEQVTEIESSAFRDCPLLEEIVIPMSVTGIGDYAFGNNPLLTIYVENSERPKNWASFWNNDIPVVWGAEGKETIDGYTYSFATANGEKTAKIIDFDDSITNFVAPQTVNGYTVNGISKGIFLGHSNLVSAVLPAGVDNITKDTFKDCPNFVYNEFGNGCYVGTNDGNQYYALLKATNKSITSAEINQDCRVMAEEAFKDCYYMTSLVINDGITYIPRNAFENCERVSSLTIPSSVKKIGDGAFHACSSVTSLQLNEGLEEIGGGVFSYCISIQSVTFPASLKKMGSDVFSQGYGLQFARFLSEEPPEMSWNIFIYRWDSDEFSIIIPKGSLAAYQAYNEDSWQQYAVPKLVEADE